MALLPPNFVPLPVANLLLVGCLLEDMTNRDPEEPRPPGLCIGGRPFARRRPKTGPSPSGLPWLTVIHSLRATGVSVVPGAGSEGGNPFSWNVAVEFRDERGRPFYRAEDRTVTYEEGEEDCIPGASVEHLTLYLQRPVEGCLSRPRIQENVNSRGLVGSLAPMPSDLELVIAPFERHVTPRFRQALALGLLEAFVVDADCHSTPIPPTFWRQDVALPLFTEAVQTGVDVYAGRRIQGHVFVDAERLRDGWHSAFHRLPAAATMAQAEYRPAGQPPAALVTPGIEFLQRAAERLGYVNGRPTKWDLSQEQIAAYIERKWVVDAEKDPRLGPYVKGMSQTMARLIVRPNDIKQGRRNAIVEQQRAEWEKIFKAEFGIENNALANA